MFFYTYRNEKRGLAEGFDRNNPATTVIDGELQGHLCAIDEPTLVLGVIRHNGDPRLKLVAKMPSP